MALASVDDDGRHSMFTVILGAGTDSPCRRMGCGGGSFLDQCRAMRRCVQCVSLHAHTTVQYSAP